MGEVPSTPVSRPSPGSSSGAAGDDLRDQKAKERSLKAAQRNKEKRHQAAQARLQGILNKHSELLKKEVLRKRAILEKELRQSIHKELTALRPPQPAVSPVRSPPPSQTQSALLSSPDRSATTKKKENQPKLQADANVASPIKAKSPPKSQKKRKASARDQSPRAPVVDGAKSQSELDDSTVITPPAAKKAKKRSTSGAKAGGGGGAGRTGGNKAVNKDEKLYCVCRTPFDNSKFWVGCDVCAEWYHGDCVGITQAMSENMSDFVCDMCQSQNRVRFYGKTLWD